SDVELDEVRELLGARHRGVDGDAAGGHTVLAELADGAEISGAEKRHPVLSLPVVAAARFLQAEAGKAGIVAQRPRDAVFRHAEIARPVAGLGRAGAVEGEHPDLLREVHAEMEEGDRIDVVRRAVEGELWTEADPAV